VPLGALGRFLRCINTRELLHMCRVAWHTKATKRKRKALGVVERLQLKWMQIPYSPLSVRRLYALGSAPVVSPLPHPLL
jgi:hypothetical protein